MSPTDLSRGAAVILCGGASRRMGRPKAWLEFGPETLLQRAVRAFAPHVGRVVVSAAPGQSLPPLPSETMFAYDSAPGGGPLHGLAAGLETLAASPNPPEWFYWTGCDYPWTSPALLRLLVDVLRSDEALDAVVPEQEGFLQPLRAVYRPAVAAPLARFLANGRARALDFLGDLNIRVVPSEEWRAAGVSPEAFVNLNTPEAYAAALERLRLPSR